MHEQNSGPVLVAVDAAFVCRLLESQLCEAGLAVRSVSTPSDPAVREAGATVTLVVGARLLARNGAWWDWVAAHPGLGLVVVGVADLDSATRSLLRGHPAEHLRNALDLRAALRAVARVQRRATRMPAKRAQLRSPQRSAG